MNTKRSVKSKIISHLDGDIRPEEQQEILVWMNQSEENARYYAEIKDIWEATQANFNVIAGTEQEWKEFVGKVDLSKKTKNHKIGNDWRRFLSIAAVLMLGVFIGVTVVKILPAKNEPLFCSASAPKGSISQMLLPDSTVIFLNAGSEIKYSVDLVSSKREVFLKGEAWFKVARDRKRPFVVHTGFYDVQVLGTEFNVKAYDSDLRIETTLEEGSVQILSTEKFRMAGQITLNPGEQMVYNKGNNNFQVKSVDAHLFSSWKENKLEFIKMSLRELLVLLERKYGVNIEVVNPEILDYHYSGTIKNESILDVMNILEHTLALKYNIEDQKIRLYKK